MAGLSPNRPYTKVYNRFHRWSTRGMRAVRAAKRMAQRPEGASRIAEAARHIA
jgi:hypothetical protein